MPPNSNILFWILWSFYAFLLKSPISASCFQESLACSFSIFCLSPTYKYIYSTLSFPFNTISCSLYILSVSVCPEVFPLDSQAENFFYLQIDVATLKYNQVLNRVIITVIVLFFFSPPHFSRPQNARCNITFIVECGQLECLLQLRPLTT